MSPSIAPSTYIISGIPDFKHRVERRIDEVITSQKQNARLQEAISFATQPGGKLIRPQLVYDFFHLALGSEMSSLGISAVVDCAVALELIHTYSLVHDDLPAMDNSLLRRGRPTCWAVHGEATAILVGDALIPLAYEILCDIPTLSDSQKITIMRLVSKTIGANGLVAGQMMDLFPEMTDREVQSNTIVTDREGQANTKVTDRESQADAIELMQILKTGVLLGAACGVGVILGGRTDLLDGAIHFGERLGLLYQLTDDLLDKTGTAAVVGKTVNNDQDKMTFLSIFGEDKVQQIVGDLAQELKVITERDFSASPRLMNLIFQIVNRVK